VKLRYFLFHWEKLNILRPDALDISVDLIFEPLDGAMPVRTVAFLHGILGRGMNLRATATRLVEVRPAWQALLVDLRGHGRSPKGTASPSLEAAARDVAALADKTDLPLAVIVGHSFGGKVALEAARIGRLPSLEQVVVIDSVPGPIAPRGGDSALGVIETLESLPSVFASKPDFIRAIMTAGQPRPVAEWLTTSLERQDGQFRFGLDLNEIRALILDYFERDLWPVVENPPGTANVHLIIAEQSDTYSPVDRERAMRIAASTNRVTADIISGGHWLHVDNPGGLLDSLLFSL
jgi:pimeloyl-ACP methyl ester carboxylesterase